jgi:hypothetical protein
MRIRSIKPSFWQHRMHSRISLLASNLAVGLLNLADDEGRFEADAAAIKSLLFTYRATVMPEHIEKALQELAAVRFIYLYDVEIDLIPVRCGVVTTFSKHQTISRSTPSSLPKPPRNLIREEPKIAPGSLHEDSMSAPGSLHEDSMSAPGSLHEDSMVEGREGRKEGRKEVPPPPQAQSAGMDVVPGREVPTEDQVYAFGDSWPGHLGVGAPPGIPKGWLSGWIAWRFGSSDPFPADWQSDITRRFVRDWSDPGSVGHRSAHSNGSDLGFREKMRALDLLKAKVESHPANPQGSHSRAHPSAEEKNEFRELSQLYRQKRDELLKQTGFA